jgi:hypothetical protein
MSSVRIVCARATIRGNADQDARHLLTAHRREETARADANGNATATDVTSHAGSQEITATTAAMVLAIVGTARESATERVLQEDGVRALIAATTDPVTVPVHAVIVIDMADAESLDSAPAPLTARCRVARAQVHLSLELAVAPLCGCRRQWQR